MLSSARITMITLAVDDLERSRAFYAAIGWEEAEGGNEKIAFYKANGQYFSLYSRGALEGDLDIKIPAPATGAVTCATNYASQNDVDAAFATAVSAGAKAVTEPEEVFWGGYSGTYADPDGHLWEVAHNPFWDFDAKGNLAL